MKKFLSFLLIGVIAIFSVGVIFLMTKLNKINYQGISAEDIKINEGVEEL